MRGLEEIGEEERDKTRPRSIGDAGYYLNSLHACASKQLDVMSTQSSAVTVRVQNMSAKSDLIKNSAERGPSAVVLGLVDQGRRT